MSSTDQYKPKRSSPLAPRRSSPPPPKLPRIHITVATSSESSTSLSSDIRRGGDRNAHRALHVEDLLLQIFYWVLEVAPGLVTSASLRSVCHFWETIFLKNSRLWSYINIINKPPGSGKPPIGIGDSTMLETIVGRSKECPLNVRIWIQLFDDYDIRGHVSEIQWLVKNKPDWAFADISIPISTYTLLRDELGTTLWGTRGLYLTIHHGSDSTRDIRTPRSHPSMESYNMFRLQLSAVVSRQETRDPTPWYKLTRLQFTIDAGGAPSDTTPDWLNMLEGCKCLKALSIFLYATAEYTGSRDPLELKYLESLFLERTTDPFYSTTTVLKLLQCPALHNLHIGNLETWPLSARLSLLSFLQRTSGGVIDLEIHQMSLEREQFSGLLQLAPNLIHLTICDSNSKGMPTLRYVTNEVLNDIAEAPHLKTFSIGGKYGHGFTSFRLEHLVNVFETRLKSHKDTGDYTGLERVDITGLVPEGVRKEIFDLWDGHGLPPDVLVYERAVQSD